MIITQSFSEVPPPSYIILRLDAILKNDGVNLVESLKKGMGTKKYIHTHTSNFAFFCPEK